MTETAVSSQPPVMGYFAYWIRQFRLANELPSVLANRSVRAAIHAAPPACRPPPVEAWMFELATDHAEALDCGHIVGWLRLRRVLGDAAGVLTRKRRGTGPGTWVLRPSRATRAGCDGARRSPAPPHPWASA